MVVFYYKIVCKTTNITDLYVGQTSQFNRKKHAHSYNCSNPSAKYYDLKLYVFIRANGGWNNWQMEIIEECVLNSTIEYRKRKRHWIDLLNSNLNSNIPMRTQTERNSDNTEKREANYINKRIQRINEGRLVYRSRFDSQIFVNSYMNNVYDANNVYLIE